MTLELEGAEFAAFASQDETAWEQLHNKTVHHDEYGTGTVRAVKLRPRHPPLLTVHFDSRQDSLLFNADSFDKGRFTCVSVPTELLPRIETWRKAWLEARQNRERVTLLITKYNISISVDNSLMTNLADLTRVLGKLDEQGALAWRRTLRANDLVTLGKQVDANIQATSILRRYQREGNPWDLVIACTELRKAGLQEHAVDATETVDFALLDAKTASALLTTRGGALRDLDRREEAIECANVAVRLTPDAPQPYNLLGALQYEAGLYAEGDKSFEQAAKLGASATDRRRAVESALARTSETARSALLTHLLRKRS